MELLQLTTFITLAKYENMSITAQALNTSQPQVSKLLASLEAELGTQLFDRVGRGVKLNEHGKIFIKYATDAITTMQNGRIAMQNLKNSILGTITIQTEAFSSILNDCVCAFQKENPNINFRYISNNSGFSTENDVDILLVPSLDGHYSFEAQFPVVHKILEEEYYFVIPEALHLFPQTVNSLSIREIIDLPFIIMGSPDMQIKSDYWALLQVADSVGVMPHISHSVNEFALKMSLVAHNAGVCILPQVCLEQARQLAPCTRFYRITDINLHRSVLIARKPRDILSSAANAFWDFAQNYYQ